MIEAHGSAPGGSAEAASIAAALELEWTPPASASASALTQPAALAPVGTAELRLVWRSFWRSRLLILIAGCMAGLWLAEGPGAAARFDPTGITSSFGSVGNVLAAPFVRWDALWYMRIAHGGYTLARETRFFPLYPLWMKVAALLTGGSSVLAGILISLVALFTALVIVYRLTTLELGARVGALTVELIAFGPLAFYLSAVYTESLFLALSAGTFYAARRGRWATAGMLGALAAMTRVTGVLLIVPVVLLFLYGPRADRPPVNATAWWRPRYRPTPALLWALLIPFGLGAFSALLVIAGYEPLAFLHAQTTFSHHELVAPVIGAWDGMVAAAQQLKLDAEGLAGTIAMTQSVAGFAALCAALLALRGVVQRLPPAYAAFVVVGLLVPLSSPTIGDPLKGLPRYTSVLFPLYMAAAAWAIERGVRRSLLIGFSVLLVLFTAQFASWHVVGSSLI